MYNLAHIIPLQVKMLGTKETQLFLAAAEGRLRPSYTPLLMALPNYLNIQYFETPHKDLHGALSVFLLVEYHPGQLDDLSVNVTLEWKPP